ncbi:MAG: hypothetical protein WDM80_01280 [Limisphaerales bacterium]
MAGLGLLTLALYLPSLHHSFVEYDDQQYVTDNPRVQAGLTWAGLIWAFGFHAGNWHPLAWLSHMLDCQIYGANAWGPSSDQYFVACRQHVASFSGVTEDDRCSVAQCHGGGIVCLASLAC